MALSPFAGRVFVIAGSAPVFGVVADGLMAAGALVAVVGTAPTTRKPAAHFRADPGDAEVWERVVPHVEQRLGPIDAVVTAPEGQAIAERLVGADLLRRGHGTVLVANNADDATDLLRTLTNTL